MRSSARRELPDTLLTVKPLPLSFVTVTVFLHEFPNLQWLKKQASTGFADQQAADRTRLPNTGWPTVILNATTREVMRDNIPGPLSLFTNVKGNSVVTVDKKRVQLSPETFFICNSGQRYTLEIHEKNPTETFNIHIGDHFASEAMGSLVSTAEQSLEGLSPHFSHGFHNRLVPSSPEFQNIFYAIHHDGKNQLALDEKLFSLLTLLMSDQKKVEQMKERLTSMKTSTREEVLRRLLNTTDYLYSNFTRNPSLNELAKVSCLSKFHFLRLFKAAYRQTPHQFITQLKIGRAKELLSHTATDVKVIASNLGFDDASTFSRLFHYQTGVYPTQYRANS